MDSLIALAEAITDCRRCERLVEWREKIAQENKVEILIHGHVHRPKVHNEAFGQRIVLGDWDKKYWFISLKGEKISLHSSEIT